MNQDDDPEGFPMIMMNHHGVLGVDAGEVQSEVVAGILGATTVVTVAMAEVMTAVRTVVGMEAGDVAGEAVENVTTKTAERNSGHYRSSRCGSPASTAATAPSTGCGGRLCNRT